MSETAGVRRSIVAVASACVLVATTTPVRAHDPPVCFDVRWRADTRDPRMPAAGDSDEQAVCMSNRGLAFLDPSSRTWRIACAKALGIPSTESPDFFYAPDGRLLVAASSGLLSNADGGCTWTEVPMFAGDNTTALAQDATDPARFVLTTGGRVAKPDGVYESLDGGTHWNELATIAQGEFYEDLLIAPSNPRRLYAAATAFGTGSSKLTRFVARSNDGGVTWTRIDQELGPDESGLRALAVHPSDPDTVLFLVLASDRTQSDRLRLSTDAGATFSDVLSAPRITDASFGKGGGKAWATALSSIDHPGLWRSSDAARSFEAIAGPYYMGCAFERTGALHVCGRWNMPSPFGGVARSRDDGKTFETWMLFEEICDPVACDPSSVTTEACADLWLDWQYEIHGCTGVYGGAPAPTGATANPVTAANVCGCPAAAPAPASDSGAGGSSPVKGAPDGGTPAGVARRSADCGCHAVGRDRGPDAGFAWAVLLLFASIRGDYLHRHP